MFVITFIQNMQIYIVTKFMLIHTHLILLDYYYKQSGLGM